MGMDKACESLLSQPRVPAAERKIYLGMLEGLKQGESIGKSMSRAGMVVSNLEREVITAAETGGMLEKGFAHLAEYFRRMHSTMRNIRKGMTYPIVLVHLALPLTVFASAMLKRFVPGGGVRPLGEALMDSGSWVLQIYLCTVVLLILGFVLAKMAKNSVFLDRLFNLVPILGKARKYVAMERFCRVFEIFLMAGLKMSDSLAGSGKASGSGVLHSASNSGARQIEQGQNLTEAMFSHPSAFPDDFNRGVAAAEESGLLDVEMRQWGNFYSESAGEAMDSLAEWTPRLFYWLVLLIVAGMIIRVGLAYRDLLQGILDYGI